MIKSKSILITGVAGMIGSRLADWMIENDLKYNIIGIDNFLGGYIDNVNKKVILYERDFDYRFGRHL
jgi:UDP-glucose 4-epimerase